MMEQLNGKRAHFNSRLLTETNKNRLYQLPSLEAFQFTSPYGDEPSGWWTKPLGTDFNSRLLTETIRKYDS